MSSDEANFETELRSLLANGRKIEAIKLYRERTGAGLAEAKEAVETMEQGGTLPAAESSELDLQREVISLLEQGKKIEAIKLYRQRTGLGLAEAKQAVETIAAERHIVVPSGTGCFGVLVFVLAVCLAAALNVWG